MKNVFLLLSTILIIGSCSTLNKCPEHSAWTNVSIGEDNGEKGAVVTTLFFTSDKDVTVMSSVKSGDKTIVRPYVYAVGTYSAVRTSKSKDGTHIEINALTIDNKEINFVGNYRNNAMILKSDAGVPRLFAYVKNVEVK